MRRFIAITATVVFTAGLAMNGCAGKSEAKTGDAPSKEQSAVEKKLMDHSSCEGHDHGSHEGHDHGSHEGHDHENHEGHDHDAHAGHNH